MEDRAKAEAELIVNLLRQLSDYRHEVEPVYVREPNSIEAAKRFECILDKLCNIVKDPYILSETKTPYLFGNEVQWNDYARLKPSEENYYWVYDSNGDVEIDHYAEHPGAFENPEYKLFYWENHNTPENRVLAWAEIPKPLMDGSTLLDIKRRQN